VASRITSLRSAWRSSAKAPIRQIARSRCVCGTRVSGDISISIDDCFLSSPRIVLRRVSSMRQMSIPDHRFFGSPSAWTN
jgi:hypothetical protein